MYENCKGNRDYDLKSNNEIAKVKQLEIERGKSMLSFYQNIKQTSKGLKKSKFNYV